MQFTKAEEYGVLGAVYLAGRGQANVTPLSQISEESDIPDKFLAKIFQSLSRAEIVRSHRGVQGGFTLAKDAADISVRDILEAIQGPYHLAKCTADRKVCEKEGLCALREVLMVAEHELNCVFEHHSIADLVRMQHNLDASQ